MGIMNATKAMIKQDGDKLVVEPQKDFWSLGGAMKSPKKLSEEKLKKARSEFESKWASND